MKLGEFIKNFSHNNIIRLLYKNNRLKICKCHYFYLSL